MRTIEGMFLPPEVQQQESMAAEVGDLPAERRAPTQPERSTTGRKLLDQAIKLVPGEAIAAHAAITAAAETGLLTLVDQSVAPAAELWTSIILAWIFLFYTIGLRYRGTLHTLPDGSRKPQWYAVVISALAYVLLIYSTGAQLGPHAPLFADVVKDGLAENSVQMAAAGLLSMLLGFAATAYYADR